MLHIDAPTRQAILATLASAATIDHGPTEEQQRLLSVIGNHVLGLDGGVDHLAPDDSARALPDDATRRVVIEGLIVLELTRHPASKTLTDRVSEYITALGGNEDTLAIGRDYVADAREQVAKDWARTQEDVIVETEIDEAEDTRAIARKLRALASCPAGSVGRAFHDFYQRNGFPLPVDHTSLIGHDFAHVLAGYEATPEGELALQAMLVAACDGTKHFSGLLASLLLFEVGMMPFPDIEPKVAVLGRPGAAELFADAIARGAQCGLDFQAVDHLAEAGRDLTAVRAELNITPPVEGPFTFSA